MRLRDQASCYIIIVFGCTLDPLPFPKLIFIALGGPWFLFQRSGILIVKLIPSQFRVL